MNISVTIKTNMEIMRLIKSKHEEGWPGGEKTQEAKYYRDLEADADKARSALASGGIASIKDPGGEIPVYIKGK